MVHALIFILADRNNNFPTSTVSPHIHCSHTCSNLVDCTISLLYFPIYGSSGGSQTSDCKSMQAAFWHTACTAHVLKDIQYNARIAELFLSTEKSSLVAAINDAKELYFNWATAEDLKCEKKTPELCLCVIAGCQSVQAWLLGCYSEH